MSRNIDWRASGGVGCLLTARRWDWSRHRRCRLRAAPGGDDRVAKAQRSKSLQP